MKRFNSSTETLNRTTEGRIQNASVQNKIHYDYAIRSSKHCNSNRKSANHPTHFFQAITTGSVRTTAHRRELQPPKQTDPLGISDIGYGGWTFRVHNRSGCLIPPLDKKNTEGSIGINFKFNVCFNCVPPHRTQEILSKFFESKHSNKRNLEKTYPVNWAQMNSNGVINYYIVFKQICNICLESRVYNIFTYTLHQYIYIHINL